MDYPGSRTDGDRVLRCLCDVEAIKQLKARYFRLLDVQAWDDWGDVFTEDCHFDLAEGGVIDGRDRYVDAVKSYVSSGHTVHHGHMPEITLIDSERAEGIWAMFDSVARGGPDGVTAARSGYGHYHETYARGSDGKWRISSMLLARLPQGSLPHNSAE
jgi:hypothetical protein